MIDRESLIGVWENIEDSSCKDDLEITFYMGGNNVSSIRIKKFPDDKCYFSEGFELIENDNKYQLIFKNSELNDGNDLVLECEVYSSNPLVFLVIFFQYGKRFMKKIIS